MPAQDWTIRLAKMADLAALKSLHAKSIRGMCSSHYGPEQIRTYLNHVGTLDPIWISDGSYFVAEDGGQLVGSGGWTLDVPPYKHYTLPTAKPEIEQAATRPTAHIRGVFVHPAWVRRGIASGIMEKAERHIAQAGYRRAELASTLNAVPFYNRLGYATRGEITFQLPDGVAVPSVSMEKELASPAFSIEAKERRPSRADRLTGV